MSSSGQPGRSRQPNFSTRSTDSSGDKDAPGAGRLARVDNPSDTGTSNLTKGGNVKMKFIPKAVGRKTADASVHKEPTTHSEGRQGGAATRGRGRGRGRGESVTSYPVSGPFAAGPVGLEKRSTRQSQPISDSSITVETVPIGGSISIETPASTAAQAQIKKEVEVKQEKSTANSQRRQSTRQTRVKREDDDEAPLADLEEVTLEERIDLADLNTPGDPVSSRRKVDRVTRQWKKIELWVEQDDIEQIVIDDEHSETSVQHITVKKEGESQPSAGFQNPDLIRMDIDEGVEAGQSWRPLESVQPRRRRRDLQGKSQEEKEEVAREEVDLEILREQFLDPHGSERDERLFLLQLPPRLPILRDESQQVKLEMKSENSTNNNQNVSMRAGKIGQLRVHASGRTELSYGGVNFPIRLASDVQFAQDFVVIDTAREGGNGKAWRIGMVGGAGEGNWLIGTPDLSYLR